MSLPYGAQTTQTDSVTKESETVWLDKLPPDVCIRIASFLEARGDYSCALNLSKASIQQLTAIKQALSYTIDVGRMSDIFEDASSIPVMHILLCDLLRDDVRELRRLCPWSYQENMKACFQSPDLVKVSITEVQGSFDNILCANNLRSLTLHFKLYKEGISLLKGLSTFDIREFEFVLAGSDCLHKHLTNDPSNYGLLAACCPRVQKLRLVCSSCRSNSPPSFLWHAMEAFCALSDVTIPERVPEDAIERLKHMNCVRLHGKSVLQLVDKLPNRVVEIKNTLMSTPCFCWASKVSPLSYSHLEKLAMCPRLEALECCIKPGTERALLQGVRNLQYLLLSVSDEWRDQDSFRCDAKIYEPEFGSVLNIVEAAPYLKTLRLGNMLVQREELREILMVLGARLEHFEEGLMSQKCKRQSEFQYIQRENKNELEKVIGTLQTAALHNPSLQVFRLYVRGEWFTYIEVIQSALSELKKTLEVLQRRSPLLDMKDWNILLHELQNHTLWSHPDEDCDETYHMWGF